MPSWESKSRPSEHWAEWNAGPVHITLRESTSGANVAEGKPWHWHVVVDDLEHSTMLQVNGYSSEEQARPMAMLCAAGLVVALRAAGRSVKMPPDADVALAEASVHGLRELLGDLVPRGGAGA